MAEYAWVLAISCGLAIGVDIGAAIERIGAGVGIGVGAGVAIGLLLYRRLKSAFGDGGSVAVGEPSRVWVV